jgi:hypothetical protein
MLKRNTLNFLIDLASSLVVLGLIATGLLARYVLPPGSGSRRMLLGLGRHDWGDIHFWIACAGGALLLVHLALHWQWTCTTVLRLCRPTWSATGMQQHPWRRNLFGTFLVLVVIGSFWGIVAAARYGVRETEGGMDGREGRGRAVDARLSGSVEREDEFVRGSMTLAQAASTGGMTPEALRAELKLPDSVSPDERLGRLSREYGFSINRVREVVGQ